jgi:hypothetical protein
MTSARRVDIKNLAHPGKQLREKVIDVKARQCGIRQRLQVLKTLPGSVVTYTNGVR